MVWGIFDIKIWRTDRQELSEYLKREDYRAIIKNQVEEYRHAEQQAQRLLRILLASFALVITFASSEVASILNLSVASRNIVVGGGEGKVIFTGFIQQMSVRTQFIGSLLLIIAGIHILDAMWNALKMHQVERLEINVKYPLDGTADVCERNRERLKDAYLHLNNCYRRIQDSIFIFAIAAAFYVAGSSGNEYWMGIVSGAYVNLAKYLPLFLLFLGIVFVYNRRWRTRDAILSDLVDSLRTRYHRAPSIVVIIATIGIYWFGYRYAELIFRAWLNLIKWRTALG